jgi:hypothetical protein
MRFEEADNSSIRYLAVKAGKGAEEFGRFMVLASAEVIVIGRPGVLDV